jgi:hypothetical protein
VREEKLEIREDLVRYEKSWRHQAILELIWIIFCAIKRVLLVEIEKREIGEAKKEVWGEEKG